MATKVKPSKAASAPKSPAPSKKMPDALLWDKLAQTTPRERHRIEHIHTALRKAWARGNEKLPNAQQIADELKVTRQTIYTTITKMQEYFGMPVELVRNLNGYRYTEEVVKSPFCQVSESEMLAVYLSHEMMAAFQGMPLLKRAQSAFRKVADLSEESISFDAAMVEDAFSITPAPHPAYFHPKHFEVCCRALLRREELVLDYTNMHGQNTGAREKRRVQPLHLTFHDFAWYLLSWDLERKAHRCFMLTRMHALKETKVKFERPKNFNPQKILRKNFSIFTSGEVVPVRLEFSKRVQRMIRERKWHRTEKFSKGADGWMQMDLEVAIAPDLVAWIGSFYDDCRIVAPIDLREDVGRRQIRAGLENLKGKREEILSLVELMK